MSYLDVGPRPYVTLKKLLAGEVVELEGIKFRAINKKIEPGDFYIAERNTGPKLLICKSVNEAGGWINPEGNNYPFDTYECIAVEEVC